MQDPRYRKNARRRTAMRFWQGPWANLSTRVREYPTMLTREELRMLHWLTHEYYSGHGCICDLGAFLGGSTMALADGLIESGRSERQIHSYDRHKITAAMWTRYIGDRLPFPDGGDFLPVMPTLMGDRVEVVKFHTGDFLRAPVPDEPIEILFIDIAKTAEVADRIVSEFFPKLIPERSVVVQQDYFHPWPVWDVAAMEILSEFFEPLSYTDQNSALFLCKKAITPTAAEPARVSNLATPDVRASLLNAGRRWPHTAQRVAIYNVLRLLEAEGLRPLSERREDQAKRAMQAYSFSRTEFESMFVDEIKIA